MLTHCVPLYGIRGGGDILSVKPFSYCFTLFLSSFYFYLFLVYSLIPRKIPLNTLLTLASNVLPLMYAV